LRNGSDQDDISDSEGRLGQISTGEWGVVSRGKGEQSAEECVYPEIELGVFVFSGLHGAGGVGKVARQS
jgi:hypothetical protein